MTISARVTLAAALETGDSITQTTMQNLIDSYLHLSDATAQSITSNVSLPTLYATTEVATPLVSAAAINASAMNVFGVVSAQGFNGGTALFTTVSAALVVAGSVQSERVSAASLTVGTFQQEVTARASVGSASITPASVHGFLIIKVSGINVGVPFYRI